MKIKDILDLGGKEKTKAVMTSKVLVATGDTKLVEFAGKLWDLIVDTDYIRASVHGVLVEGYSHQESSEIYGDKMSYLRNLVGLEGVRLKEDLGKNVYPLLVGEEEGSKELVEALNSIVEGLIEESNPLEETVYEHITIDLKGKRAYRETRMSDTEYIKFVRENDFLSKPKMENLVEDLDSGDLGYIVYLLRTKDEYLTDNDKIRKDILREVWWL